VQARKSLPTIVRVGRGGIRPRNRRRQAPEATGPARGLFDPQNSPYTLEGELEGFARFGRGLPHTRGKLRWLAIFLAIAVTLPLLAGLLSLLI
jgi:hypothetical protein